MPSSAATDILYYNIHLICKQRGSPVTQPLPLYLLYQISRHPAQRRRSLPPVKPQPISHFPPRHPATRRHSSHPSDHKETQPFLPGVQQRADAHPHPSNHNQSHTFLPGVQQRADAHPIRQTTRKLSLSFQASSAALMPHPTTVRPPYPSQHDRTVEGLQQRSGCFGVSLGSYLAWEVSHGEVPGGHKPQGKVHLSEPCTHQRTWRVMDRPLREAPPTLSMTRRNDGTRTSAANLPRPSASSCPHHPPVL